MLFNLKLTALVGLAVMYTAVVLGGEAKNKPANESSPAALEFFEKKVRPVLVNHCYTCHSAETKPAGGLRVDDRNGLLTGGNTGAAVVPGKPDESLLIRRVTQDNKRRMPLEGKVLTADQIADLKKWIKDGAVWPAVNEPISLGTARKKYAKLREEHWAWQPLTRPNPPAVSAETWPLSVVDRFVLAKLEAKNLQPVSDADRVTLIRRVTYDLTGLPPTPAAVKAFVEDPSADAFSRVVDQLIGSPAFGERWGRHWLDVARFGESTGPSRNIPYPFAWRYRDYVIDSVNKDVPYDQFLREQIAGDLLPAENGPERDRLNIATGFLALGVKDVNQRFKVRFVMDNVDEQIDAVTRSALGLSVSCARCHDHKFDPIPTTDYYALAGIFTSTDNCAGVRNKMGGGGLDYYDTSMLIKLGSNLPPPPAEEVKKLKEQVAQAKAEWDGIRGTPEGLAKGPNGQPKQRPFRLKLERLQAELAALSDPAARGFAAHGARDARVVGDTQVRIRGEAEKLGQEVPRGFLTAFEVPGAAKVNPRQSGRLELAGWITNPKNPLTSRVIVNRVWQRLFGKGIVSTVDNFGVTGDRPSHPELLDFLAGEFIREGYSIKHLVRTLVLSRAYQLGGDGTGKQREVDPDNRFLWRHSPRRLDAEEIRDAMLVSAGSFSERRPEASPAKNLKMVEMRDNGPEAKTLHQTAAKSTHRSIYLPLLRGITPGSLEAFDPVEQTLVTGARDVTTVPGQALYLLNSSFVRRQSLVLAEKLLAEHTDDPVRIGEAYARVLGRKPTSKELDRAGAFLDAYESTYREEAVNTPVERPKKPAIKPKSPKPMPANPDEIDQTGEAIIDEEIRAKDGRTAAWLALIQALYGSAEFRYVR